MPEAEAEQGHQEEGGGMPLGMETVEELPSWESGSSSQICEAVPSLPCHHFWRCG